MMNTRSVATEASGDTLRLWWEGARPRTLGASVIPVVVGSAAAVHAGQSNALRMVAALVVAIGLQVGVNYANDYFDGVRNIDTSARIGPRRLVGSGAVAPQSVLFAAAFSVSIAAIVGTILAITTDSALLWIGAAAIAATILYSGGPQPYGALGLGEVGVFVFFGLVATCGTTYVVAGFIPSGVWWLAGSMGCLAVAILVVNNLRDISTDGKSGKRTLAVRMGAHNTRSLFRAVVALSLVLPLSASIVGVLPRTVMLVVVAIPFALRAMHSVQYATGRGFAAAFLTTIQLHAALGVLITIALVVGR